jgi:hypothetical protein
MTGTTWSNDIQLRVFSELSKLLNVASANIWDKMLLCVRDMHLGALVLPEDS